MKTFHDFICLREEGDGMPLPQDPMGSGSMGSGSSMPNYQPMMKPPGQDDSGEDIEPPPEAAAEMEGITNDIKRQVQRLFDVLKRHNLSRQKTVVLLNTLIQQVAVSGNVTANNAVRTTRSAMQKPPPAMQQQQPPPG